MTESLQDRLIRHEGIKLAPYRDQNGYLTIGIGRCLDTEGITHDEAIYLLQNDIRHVQQQVVAALPWILGIDDERQEVVYELCFWIGINGLLQFKRLLAAIQQRDWKTASDELLHSNLHREVPARTEELADHLLQGE